MSRRLAIILLVVLVIVGGLSWRWEVKATTTKYDAKQTLSEYKATGIDGTKAEYKLQ